MHNRFQGGVLCKYHAETEKVTARTVTKLFCHKDHGIIPFTIRQITTIAWASSQEQTVWDVSWRNRRMRTSARLDPSYVCFCCDWQGLPGPIGVAGLVGPIGSMVSLFEYCLGNRKPNNLTLMLHCAIVLSRARWGCLVHLVTLVPRVKRWVLLLLLLGVLFFYFNFDYQWTPCWVLATIVRCED